MKTTKFYLILTLIALLLLSACGGGQNTQPQEATTPPTEEVVETPTEEPTPEPSPIVLTITNDTESISLTMEELQAMDIVEGWAGTKSSTGTVTPPQLIKGVRMSDLADLVGGLTEDFGINIVAKDGYSITMSYDQMANGNFVTYDPGTGDEIEYDDVLIPVVAFERDGEPIPADEDGPLRNFILSEENDQVTDGHWSVKWVTNLDFRPVSADWSLYLEGVTTEEVDRVSFESCMASGCHQESWTDGDGNVWAGTPLYYFAGRVDGGNVHEDRSFDDNYAEAGYAIEIFAADGYNVAIDSTQAMFNKAILLANQYNGQDLDEEYGPLRLVGDDLEGGQMVGQVVQIVLNPNDGVTPPPAKGEEAEAVDLTLPEGIALKVVGAVRNSLQLETANLEALGIVENVTVEHPKKGPLSYSGLPINTLLTLAGIDAETTAIVAYAADGYSATIPLADIQSCENCLIVIEEDGTLSTAMDNMEGANWVGDLVVLQVITTELVEEEPAAEDTDEETEAAIGTPSETTIPDGAALEVSGSVSEAMTFTAADLNALGVVDLEIEHPKNGPTMYAGVPVNAILQAAGVSEDAATMVITASDGYSVEVPLSDVLACENCLVALLEDGTLMMAMGGLESSTWVKDVVALAFN